jgi:DNA-directed RNA polymerase alpha subunit
MRSLEATTISGQGLMLLRESNMGKRGKIDAHDLPRRVQNALRKAGVTTHAELRRTPQERFLRFRGCGDGTLAQIDRLRSD